MQRVAHLLPQLGDESIRVERELQSFIELVSARIEIGRKILVGVLARAPSERLVVMGDFNQKIAKSSHRRSDKAAHRAALLQRAIPPHVTLATSALEYRGRRTIDHVGLSADMAAGSLDVISNIQGERKLSDHFGVVADVLVQGS